MTAYDDLIVARTPRLYLPLHTDALSVVGPNPTTTDFVGGQEFVTGPEAFGQGTRFRSADTEELRISSTLLQLTAAHTIECWFRRSGNPAAIGTLYRWNGRGTTMKINATGQLRLSWFNSSGVEQVATRSENICDGFWHHCVMMFTGQGLTWYSVIDGEALSHGAATPSWQSSLASIGSSQTTEFLDAELCGVAAYASAVYYDSTAADPTTGVEAQAMATYYAGLRDLGDLADVTPPRVRITVRDEERAGPVPIASRSLNPVAEPDVRVTDTALNINGGIYVDQIVPVDHDTFFAINRTTTNIEVYVMAVAGDGTVSLADTILLPLSTVSTALGGASVIVNYSDFFWWNDRFWARLAVGPFGSSAEPILAGYDWDGTNLTFYGAWRPLQGDPSPHLRTGNNGNRSVAVIDDDWVLMVGQPGASTIATPQDLQAVLFQHVPGGPTVDGFGPFTLSTDAGRVAQTFYGEVQIMEDGSAVLHCEMFADSVDIHAGEQWFVLDPDTGTPTITRAFTARRPPPAARAEHMLRNYFSTVIDLGGGRCVTTAAEGRTDWSIIEGDTLGVIAVYRYDDGTFDLPPRALRVGGSSGITPGIIPGHDAVLIVVTNMIEGPDPDFAEPWEEGTLGWFIVSFDENGFMHEWPERLAAAGQRLDWSAYADGTCQLSAGRAVTYLATDFNGYVDPLNVFFVVDT